MSDLWGGAREYLSDEAREAAFLAIRSAEAAAAAIRKPHRAGAFAVFPTTVAKPGSYTPWSMQFTREPGDLYQTGVHEVGYSTEVEGWYVKGVFYVVVGVDESYAGAANYRITDSSGKRVPAARADAWAKCLPQNLVLAPKNVNQLRLEARRMMATAAKARDELILDARPAIREQLARQRQPIAMRSSYLNEEDVAQELARSATLLIANFSSPRRPNTTWAAALRMALQRDAPRAVLSLDADAENVKRARQWAESHPEISDPHVALERWAFELAYAREKRAHRDWSHDQLCAAAEANPGKPTVDVEQMRYAMRRTELLSLSRETGDDDGSSYVDHFHSTEISPEEATMASADDLIESLTAVMGEEFREVLLQAASGEQLPVATLRKLRGALSDAQQGQSAAILDLRSRFAERGLKWGS
ncbi:MAG TPA: hypothetical protein VHD87_12655 [Acidimicrobiales bacterium]|nr:hypothetical protein [Acidimicrobiales bacterium]